MLRIKIPHLLPQKDKNHLWTNLSHSEKTSTQGRRLRTDDFPRNVKSKSCVCRWPSQFSRIRGFQRHTLVHQVLSRMTQRRRMACAPASLRGHYGKVDSWSCDSVGNNFRWHRRGQTRAKLLLCELRIWNNWMNTNSHQKMAELFENHRFSCTKNCYSTTQTRLQRRQRCAAAWSKICANDKAHGVHTAGDTYSEMHSARMNIEWGGRRSRHCQ